MKSFLSRGLSSLSPSPSRGSANNSPGPDVVKSGRFTTATEKSLFTKVNPQVDGEDCDKDCASCTIRYPAKFSIDLDDKMYGNVKGWATHMLVATGKTDWVRDVGDEKGSVMEAIDKKDLKPSNGKLKLSASNMPVPDEYHQHKEGEQPTNVLILPAFTIVENVTPALAPELIKDFVNSAPTTTTSLSPTINDAVSLESKPSKNVAGDEDATTSNTSATEVEQPSTSTATPQTPSLPDLSDRLNISDPTANTPLHSRPCPHAAVILLCSQRTRDARCGQSAPLLRREFERHLRPHGLYRDMHDERPGGVGIYFISHVGGHKYSANVLIYRRRDFEWFRKSRKEEKGNGNGNVEDGDAEGAAQGIWLARVRPEDCEGIVDFTVLQGKVIKPDTQLRGGFDREKGLISW